MFIMTKPTVLVGALMSSTFSALWSSAMVSSVMFMATSMSPVDRPIIWVLESGWILMMYLSTLVACRQ